MSKKIKSFTIVELVIVIAIIAILAAVLIPVFGLLIEKAYISNDLALTHHLNTQLTVYEAENGTVTKESQLNEVLRIAENASLTPYSAKYGYHFWFDIYSHGFVLSRVDGAPINSIDGGEVSSAIINMANSLLCGLATYSYAADDNEEPVKGVNLLLDNVFRTCVKQGYYLVDKSGSSLATAISILENPTDGDAYKYAIEIVYGLKNDKQDSSAYETLKEIVNNTIIFSNNGTFEPKAHTGTSEDAKVFFANGISAISSNHITFCVENEGEISIDNTLATLRTKAAEIVIPETVTTPIEKGCLIFENGIGTTIVLPPNVDIHDFFTAGSTNALIKKTKDGLSEYYVVSGKEVHISDETGDVGEKVGNDLPYSHGSIMVVLPHTDLFLYRIGNHNPVSIKALLKYENDWEGDVQNIDIETITGNAHGVEKDGGIQFTGTGVVLLKKETTNLYLEIVDAENSTTAINAETKNVVLLNDVSFTTITVSNGYSLYGNGFKMTCSQDLPVKSLLSDNGYVNLNNGTLDNVQIVCPVFTKSVLYSSNATLDDGGKFMESRNAVSTTGKNTIANSYISGGRAAIFASGTQLIIENTTIHGGALANILVRNGISLKMTDCITEQEVEKCTSNGNKTMMGLGVLVEDMPSQIVIEGELKQYNWVTQSQVNLYAGQIASNINSYFSNQSFKHTFEGVDYVNTGFVYICAWDPGNNNDNMPANFIDMRSDKSTYSGKDVSLLNVNGGIYTVNNSCPLAKDMLTIPGYIPTRFNPTAPTFSFNNSVNTNTDYSDNTISGSVNSDYVDLDFSGVQIIREGQNVDYTISVDSNLVSINGNIITFSKQQTLYTVYFTVNINGSYLPDGSVDATKSNQFMYYVNVALTVDSYPPPVWNNVSTTGSNHVWVVKNPGTPDPDYAELIPAYNAIKVNYYNQNGDFVEKDLSNELSEPIIADSNKLASVTFSDNSRLIIETAYDGNNFIFKKCGGKMYLYQSRYYRDNRDETSKTLKYTFYDPNGQQTENTVSVVYSFNTTTPGIYIKEVDFLIGKYTTCSGEKSCVVEGTLITLADGSKVPVEDLTGEEKLLVWNLETGSYDSAEIFCIDHRDLPEKEYVVNKITFSDDTFIEIVGEQGFFDMELAKYVYVNHQNYEQYVGHSFVKYSDNGSFMTVKLENVEEYTMTTKIYSPVTYGHLVQYANDMLTMPGELSGYFNYFEVDTTTLSYDKEKMARDIELYGLVSYEEYAIIPEYTFNAFNTQYVRIALGKGILIWEDNLARIEHYMQFVR